MSSPGGSGFSRETRLLVATIGVSIVVLLVLARFRFPESSGDSRDGSASQPLARLAARAAFDDLSLAVRELSTRVSGGLMVVRVSARRGDRPTDALLPALRVRDDVAVVLPGDGRTVEAILGVAGPAVIVARDRVRGLVLVRVPSAVAPVLSLREGRQPLAAPGYLAVAEASAAGAALRPIFVGRSDGVGDPRWDTPLLTLGRSASGDEGAPAFTLDGRLAGIITATDSGPAVVPAEVVLATVDQLLRSGEGPLGDIGVHVQGLDARLAAATGVTVGAAIVSVRDDGPADNILAPGDVITAVNGQPVASPDGLIQRVARTAPGTPLTMTVRRGGTFTSLPITVGTLPPPAAAPAPTATAPQTATTLGATLRGVAGRGAEVVRVASGSAAEAAGLAAGDVVTGAGRTRTPSPDAVTTAYGALPERGILFLTVERDGTTRLVALRR